MRELLKEYARVTGISLARVTREVEQCLDSHEWKGLVLCETIDSAKSQVASWPKWRRDMATEALNIPYVQEPERGEDGNAKW